MPRSGTPKWLGHFPVEVLSLPELAQVLRRLGIPTLGEFADLDEAAVLARFGTEGGFAHRLARGLDERQLALGDPPVDLTVCRALDPPADRADALAFVAVGLAEELVGRLAAWGSRPPSCSSRPRQNMASRCSVAEGRPTFHRPGHRGPGPVAARGMAAGTGDHSSDRRGHNAAAHGRGDSARRRTPDGLRGRGSRSEPTGRKRFGAAPGTFGSRGGPDR